MEACPYKKTFYRGTTRTSEKCIACFPRVEGKDQAGGGLPMQTRCMSACIGHIRLQGLVELNKDGTWKENRQSPLYYLIHVAKVALPLYPQFGTEPNGYYIPPRWVPRPYLQQMFGPGVDAAIEKYSAPDRELLAVLQLFRAQRQIIFRYEIKKGPKIAEVPVRMPSGKEQVQELYNDTIIGFNKFDKPVVTVTIDEPIHERPREKHANSI
jgi:nitrate reductase / nitrite oxidoreductase, beta subunit